MAKLVDCGVCGKKFAITDKEYESIQKIKDALNNNNTKTKFICKYCRKMIKEEN